MAAPYIAGWKTAQGGGETTSMVIDPAGKTGGVNLAAGDILIVSQPWVTGSDIYKPTVDSSWTTLRAAGPLGTGTASWGVWARAVTDPSTTYTWPVAGSGGTPQARLLMWVRGADNDPDTWVKGTFTDRSANATSTTAKAPSVTTSVIDALVVAMAYERTVASETDAQLTISPASTATDTFGRSVTDAWGTSDSGHAWACVGGSASDYSVTNGKGVLALPASITQYRRATFGSTADAEIVTSITPNVVASGQPYIPGVLLRYQSTTNYYVAWIQYGVSGKCWLEIRKGSGATVLASTSGSKSDYSAGQEWRLRAKIAGSNLYAKFWPASDTEPNAWTLTASDTAFTGAGGVGTQLHAVSGNDNPSADLKVSYDNFSATFPRDNTWTKAFTHLQDNDKTTVVAYEERGAVGAAGDATFTYPNPHAQNAAAGMVAFIPPPVSSGYGSVANMLTHDPFYISHRGGSRDWPEGSIWAYDQSVQHGMDALEIPVARTSDGVFFALHDGNLNRTSGVNVDHRTITWATLTANYVIKGTCAENNPTQPDRPYMRIETLMDKYAATHVILVDPKYLTSAQRTDLLNYLDGIPNATQRIVCKAYGKDATNGQPDGPGWSQEAKARGYTTWGYFYQAEHDDGSLGQYQHRWDILGMAFSATDAAWAAVRSHGKPVIAHICNSQADSDAAFGKPSEGQMISSPLGINAIQAPEGTGTTTHTWTVAATGHTPDVEGTPPMATGSPSWGTCNLTGEWHDQNGALLAGRYVVFIPVRTVNATDGVIVPAGIWGSGELNTTAGSPSLDLDPPASDDSADNTPTGWEAEITVTFNPVNGYTPRPEVYVLPLPLGGSIDLRDETPQNVA